MPSVDLGRACRHLSVELEADGDFVSDLLERVENIVLDHLEWDDFPSPMPAAVEHAVLVALNEAYDAPDSDPLTPAVVSLLRAFRSPGVW